MNRVNWKSVLSLSALLIFAYHASAFAYDPLELSADAAILMDAKTGQVLYVKNPFKKRPPASTTKVMTAILAIETGRLKEMVTISRSAAGVEGSSIYLAQGEVLSLSDLLYGALLKSGNDACAAIAEHIGGSIEKFAVLMNIKAMTLGAVNTNFVNPHGLPDKDHYTCAYDLALIARYAMKNRTFSDMVSTRNKVIDWPGKPWDRQLENTNKLLWRYLWAEGVKTGTTGEAGQCLISSASRDNRELVAVVLRSGNRWSDSIKLFEYGFKRFEYSQVAVAGAEFANYPVKNGKREEVPVVYHSDLGILVPIEKAGAVEKRVQIDSHPEAPVKKGQVLGSISYLVDGSIAGKVSLIAGAQVDRHGIWDRFVRWCHEAFAGIFRQISTKF